ncbi:MAG: ATP-binding protein [Anaerolineales bacterium]
MEQQNSTSLDPNAIPKDNQETEAQSSIRSLRELIDLVTGRGFKPELEEESGFAEILPFPFLALVGQMEMRLALLLSLINPAVSGVLLIGPRGTGKTTAVRSLINLLPDIERSACFYGCLPEDVEIGGIDTICPDCAKKYAEGKPLTKTEKARIVELPLNARLEDVVGGLDEHAVAHERFRLKRGILSLADQNILYIDEVNLLSDEIVDAILDAAAQGSYTIRRGQFSATYKANFTLIGSMNPEEGNLRPQILDRFGLRVIVRGLSSAQERLDAYRRVAAYRRSPRRVVTQFYQETELARIELQEARNLLPRVILPDEVARKGIQMIQALQIDSLRAEITMFEAARAYAAADGRSVVSQEDIRIVAPMALRLRRSSFMTKYFEDRSREEKELLATIEQTIPESTSQIG